MSLKNSKKNAPVPERQSGETLKALLIAISLALAIRSFVVEPFKIPSGSMIPTLLVGDYLVVTKYSYGVRLPITGTLLIPVGKPRRGDVMVFRYPDDPHQDFIKRVIGLPGDSVEIIDGRLWINGQIVDRIREGDFVYHDFRRGVQRHVYRFGEINPEGREYTIVHQRISHENRGPWLVPQGEYFMMGDNRDNSKDSREWKNKFVRADQIKGKAVFIHWSWVVDSGSSRDRSFLGDFVHTLYRVVTFQVEKIRWNRIGHRIDGLAD